MNKIQSLISYGDKIQIGAEDMDNNLIPMPKFEVEELDPENQSLKSFIDSILPPKKVVENGLIFYQFVSCDSAIVNDVIKLNDQLDSQMKIRGAKETGICTIREELYDECFDEIIRQVTIGCLQRGDLLNRIKLELLHEKDYYQKLYESLIAFSLRKVLQEKKKMNKLLQKEEELNAEIEALNADIENKEKELERRKQEEEEKEKQAQEDHIEAMKVLKFDNEAKTNKATQILTTPQEDMMVIPNK
jgi:dynein light intermediate chain